MRAMTPQQHRLVEADMYAQWDRNARRHRRERYRRDRRCILAGWLLIAAPLSILAGGFVLRLIGWGG